MKKVLPLPEVELPVVEPEPPSIPEVQIGDTVIFREGYGNIPGIVQKVHSKGIIRMWALGAQSIYPKDGVSFGTEVGMWSVKSDQ